MIMTLDSVIFDNMRLPFKPLILCSHTCLNWACEYMVVVNTRQVNLFWIILISFGEYHQQSVFSVLAKQIDFLSVHSPSWCFQPTCRLTIQFISLFGLFAKHCHPIFFLINDMRLPLVYRSFYSAHWFIQSPILYPYFSYHTRVVQVSAF